MKTEENVNNAPTKEPADGQVRANRAAVMTGVAEMRVERTTAPTPRRGEALVAVQAVGICGSDIHFFEDGRVGEDVVEPPHVLGHEASGTVVALGAGVDEELEGARVAIEPSVPCDRCRVCRIGRYNLCPQMRYLSAPPTHGAFTEYLTVKQEFLHPVGESVSFDAAALLEPLSVVLAAARLADLRLGARLVITGAGPIGLLAVQVARAAGAVDITISDVNPDRLKKAEELGADRIVDARDDSIASAGVEADMLMECSGSPQALADGIRGVRAGGTASVIGMSPDEVTVPLSFMQAREIKLVPTFRLANTYATAVELAKRGMVDLDGLVTEHFTLEQTVRALRASRDDSTMLKVIVQPQH